MYGASKITQNSIKLMQKYSLYFDWSKFAILTILLVKKLLFRFSSKCAPKIQQM